MERAPLRAGRFVPCQKHVLRHRRLRLHREKEWACIQTQVPDQVLRSGDRAAPLSGIEGQVRLPGYKHRQTVPGQGLGEALEAGTGALCDFITGNGCCNGVGLHFAADCFRKGCLQPGGGLPQNRLRERANPDFRATLDTGVCAWRAAGTEPRRGFPGIFPQFLRSGDQIPLPLAILVPQAGSEPGS